ncbi:MOSC domain-containing protein [Geminicoccaceae bacterium 1502E]|nr:MOSC domain-containing protein [Geminicoccaceae bacterium 1502E]
MSGAVKIGILALLTGTLRPLGARGVPSGIDKQPVHGVLQLGREGLAGDAQGDRRHHGGPEKAVHHYPFEHYAAWRAEQPELTERLARPGAFGENVSTLGMTEATVCVGDICRLGSALVQVSQGRQPCWRLNERFGQRGMAARVQATGRTGWYWRVLEEGTVCAGDAMALLDRPQPDWTLAAITRLLYRDTLDLDRLDALSQVEELSSSWRDLARRRLEKRAVEDWSRRLETPAG